MAQVAEALSDPGRDAPGHPRRPRWRDGASRRLAVWGRRSQRREGAQLLTWPGGRTVQTPPRVARAPRATQVLVTVCRSDSSRQWRSHPQGPPRVREAWGARRSRGSVPLFPSGCREELCSRGLRRQGTGWQSAAFWVSVAGALAALGLESQGPAPRARHRGKRQPRVVSMRLKWQHRVSSASGSCPPNPAWGSQSRGESTGRPRQSPASAPVGDSARRRWQS